MPERTADLRRVVELVERLRLRVPVVAVLGHASAWRDDLTEVLAERLPGAVVSAHDEVPAGADLTVWLELSAEEAGFQLMARDRGASESAARTMSPSTWSASETADPRRRDPPASVVTAVDVVFVPVSGVRRPRRIRFFYGWAEGVLWDDENGYVGELVDLLPMSVDLRARIRRWDATARLVVTDGGTERPDEEDDVARLDADRRPLAAELDDALGPDFVVG